jgi:hypothetical protein
MIQPEHLEICQLREEERVVLIQAIPAIESTLSDPPERPGEPTGAAQVNCDMRKLWTACDQFVRLFKPGIKVRI